MKRRQEAAEEAERQRLQAEAEAKAAQEAAEAEKAKAEAAARDQADAPGSPQSGREHESGEYINIKHNYKILLLPIINQNIPHMVMDLLL